MHNNIKSPTWADSILTVTLSKQGGGRWVSPKRNKDFKREYQEVRFGNTRVKSRIPNQDRGQEFISDSLVLKTNLDSRVIRLNMAKPAVKNGHVVDGEVKFSRSTCEELNIPNQPMDPIQRLISFCHELAADFCSSKHAPMWCLSWQLTETKSGRQITATWNSAEMRMDVHVG